MNDCPKEIRLPVEETADISCVLVRLHDGNCSCEQKDPADGACLRCSVIDAFLSLHPQAWDTVSEDKKEWIQKPLRGMPSHE